MKPIDFPESMTLIAEHQVEYETLPAWHDDKETISLWKLTWRERLCVLLFGKLWIRQLNFGADLQPQLPQVESPFTKAGKDDGS